MEGKKHAFPSPRQANCAGLKKQFYADYLRSLVDYDYADELTEEERIWLAAFTEEYYSRRRRSRQAGP